MGSSFKAKCQGCGYRAEGLVGGGIFTHTSVELWPALCVSCLNITEVNLKNRPFKCESCGGSEVTPYLPEAKQLSRPGRVAKRRKGRTPNGWTYDIDPGDIDWGDLKLDTLRRYTCPKCFERAVSFQSGGILWD